MKSDADVVTRAEPGERDVTARCERGERDVTARCERGERDVAAPRRAVRRLVVPVVLTVTMLGAAAAALSSTAGCEDDAPTPDAAVDAAPDTPII